eukprot:m.531252 g.531252  ORF g.531252 m.531252 type:complete len:216 (+) comp22030_c0_seq1:216-863(+)
MAAVTVTNIDVLNNPAKFTDPFQFEITFDCNAELHDDLEWKIIYVGSAESEDHDQVLDSILVGPIPVGTNKFTFEAPPPDWTKLPPLEICGVTVVLVTCAYKNNEFVRVGYYVNNDYIDAELRENRPEKIVPQTMVEKLGREILAARPRVTRYTIPWEDAVAVAPVHSGPVPGLDTAGVVPRSNAAGMGAVQGGAGDMAMQTETGHLGAAVPMEM